MQTEKGSLIFIWEKGFNGRTIFINKGQYNKNTNYIYNKLIIKKIIIILILITVIISILTSIILITNNNSKKISVLINTLGRQRMITQMLSKDANRKSSIMLSLEAGPLIESKEVLNQKISDINGSLEKTRNEFEEKFLSIKTYKIKYGNSFIDFKDFENNLKPIIDDMKDVWDEFNQSVNRFIDNNESDRQSKEDLIYINSHNEELLNYYDELTEEMVNIQKQSANTYMLIAGFLFVLAFIFLIITIYQLYKYIIVPLNELFKQINNIGVLNKNSLDAFLVRNELSPVINEINDGFAKLNMLIKLIEDMNKGISFEEILKHIFESFSSFIPYSHIGIALLKDNGNTLEASYGISEPSLKELPKKLFGIKAQLNKTSLEKLISNGIPRIINDLPEYVKNSDALYNKILLQEGINASISLPLHVNNKPIGVIFFSSKTKNIYKEEHVEFLKILANSIAISFNDNIFIEELLYSSILALVKMVDEKDEDTGDHIERMKEYSKTISEFLFEDSIYTDIITIRFIKDIEKFSPMHDIGKVGIKDNVLLKPGKLDFDEFNEMKMHTLYGGEVLRTAEKNIKKQNISMFKTGIEIAEGHHEKWDGSGYPYGKSGTDIPLCARIAAVADVFDALTSNRPYKKAFSFEESFNIIIEGKGKHFDPLIINSFIKHKDDIYKLYISFERSSYEQKI